MHIHVVELMSFRKVYVDPQKELNPDQLTKYAELLVDITLPVGGQDATNRPRGQQLIDIANEVFFFLFSSLTLHNLMLT